MRVESVQKPEFGVLALFARGTTGKVATDDGALDRADVKAQFHVAPFRVKLGVTKPNFHIGRLVAGVHTHAGVAFFLSKVKITVHVCHFLEPSQDIFCLSFDFLYTNTIGCCLTDPSLQAFAAGRANTIEVQAG